MKTLKIFLLLSLVITYPAFTQTWEFVGLDSLVVKQIYVSSDTLWAGTVSRISINIISGLYKSTDSGNSWKQIDTALGYGGTFGFYFNLQNNTIYLIKHILGSPFGGLLYVSLDNGESWETINGFDNTYLDWIGVSPFNENEIYVKEYQDFILGSYETVHRTIDGGANWEEITFLPASSHGRSLTFNLSLTDSSTLYASVNDRMGSTYFFKSTDKGDNWDYISEPPEVGQELITDPNTPSRIFIFRGYHLTIDDGYNWTVADSGLSDVSSYLFFYVDPTDKTTFYNLRKDGLYVTKNDPIYWQLVEGTDTLPLNLGSQGFSVSDIGNLRNVFIDITTNIIYVGTAKGLYKKTLVTAIKDNKANLLSEYILYQNYPNPFNPRTTINYHLPKSTYVTLKVYDLLGNKLEVLVNEEKQKGNYSVEFLGGKLSSGVYIYTLTAGAYRISKKMTLIK